MIEKIKLQYFLFISKNLKINFKSFLELKHLANTNDKKLSGKCSGMQKIECPDFSTPHPHANI